VLVDYNALRQAMKKIKNNFSGKKIAYPLIGAGLAKGDWNKISEIINQELDGENHTLVKFSN
jgi:O-acetyl-ADP-ribose deacetylase (regulator of RNase III)